MTAVIFHPLAEQELADAIAYYENQEISLGLELLETIEYSTKLLVRYPEMGSPIKGVICSLVIPKFPYALLYRLLDSNNIRILAIAHHKRQPLYWSKRN
jgi:toxin ParE1/3/4